jgi:hypothetical protein
MDLKIYYQKIREAEERIGEDHPVVVSTETQDGGRAGVRMEVPKSVAAKMLVDGRARIASSKEAEEFRAQQAADRLQAESLLAATRMHVTVVSTGDLEKLRTPARSKKD